MFSRVIEETEEELEASFLCCGSDVNLIFWTLNWMIRCRHCKLFLALATR